MASLDEILMALPEPAEENSVDYLIDDDLRVISVPDNGIVLGVEGDKDVNRVRFRMNRYYHGTDLSGFDIRVIYKNAAGEKNYYAVEEKTVSGDTITFIWLVAADVVAYKGTVEFIVRYYTTFVNGDVDRAFHTAIGKARSLEGMDVEDPSEAPEIVDYIARVKNDLEKSLSDLVSNTLNEFAGGKIVGTYSLMLNALQWEKTDGAYPYKYTASLEEARADYIPSATPAAENMDTVKAAGMANVCRAENGAVCFWTEREPEKDITMWVILIGQGKESALLGKAILGQMILCNGG